MIRAFLIVSLFLATPVAAAASSDFPLIAQATAAPTLTAVPIASPTATPEPSRRIPGPPLDSIFPSSEWGGPLVGVNTDPSGYPLETWLAKSTGFGKWMDANRLRVYGWLNPGIELTNSSKINTFPISYNPVPNRIEMDQAVLRLERDPDTVQQDHADWGFRFDAIYGVDYRWTGAEGYESDQLLVNNRLNGFDNPESFLMLYEPHFFKGGTIFELGRVISIPDIEAQLAPQNYLYTHSLMFDWDSYTQTGLFAWSRLSDMWSLDYGLLFGDDVAPWNPTERFPTGQLFVKWESKSNKDYVLAGVDAYNNKPFGSYITPAVPQDAAVCAAYAPTIEWASQNGQINHGIPAGTCLAGHDNLQQQNITWYHAMNPQFHNAAEFYYLWTKNAYLGGTISNGPLQYAAGGGPGGFLPGRSTAVGAVDYLEYKFDSNDFVSFRLDYMNDPRGWRTGYVTSYGSITLGVTHHFSTTTWIRPELRIEKAFAPGVDPYDNLESASGFSGTKNYQRTLGIDLIQWF